MLDRLWDAVRRTRYEVPEGAGDRRAVAADCEETGVRSGSDGSDVDAAETLAEVAQVERPSSTLPLRLKVKLPEDGHAVEQSGPSSLTLPLR